MRHLKVKWVYLHYYAPYRVNTVFVNDAYFYNKHYFLYKSSNHNYIEWQKPILDPRVTFNEVLPEIIEDNPDVLCVTVYEWNRANSYRLIDKVKKALPNITIIVGGPSVDPHSNVNFFSDKPYIDWAVYSSGEEGFYYLLEHLVTEKPIANDAANIANKDTLWPFRLFKDSEHLSKSILLDLEDEFRDHYQSIIDKNPGKLIAIRYERARGCPYNCSFCDWNSGLHNKVTRKTSNWKEEIDFFASLKGNIMVTPVDANWGIYKEDVDITRYAVTKLRNFEVTSLAKMQKARAWEIYDILATAYSDRTDYTHFGNFEIVISLQDINENVLEAIERPEIPWEEHKQYIQNFIKKFPNVPVATEIILGLPNQHPDNYIKMLEELKDAGLSQVKNYFFTLIPNSPAYKKEYQDKWGIKTKIFNVPAYFKRIDEAKSNVEDDLTTSTATLVHETNKLQFNDILEMYFLGALFSQGHYDKIHSHRPKVKLFAKKLADYMVNNNIFAIPLDGEYIPIEKLGANRLLKLLRTAK